MKPRSTGHVTEAVQLQNFLKPGITFFRVLSKVCLIEKDVLGLRERNDTSTTMIVPLLQALHLAALRNRMLRHSGDFHGQAGWVGDL